MDDMIKQAEAENNRKHENKSEKLAKNVDNDFTRQGAKMSDLDFYDYYYRIEAKETKTKDEMDFLNSTKARRDEIKFIKDSTRDQMPEEILGRSGTYDYSKGTDNEEYKAYMDKEFELLQARRNWQEEKIKEYKEQKKTNEQPTKSNSPKTPEQCAERIAFLGKELASGKLDAQQKEKYREQLIGLTRYLDGLTLEKQQNEEFHQPNR